MRRISIIVVTVLLLGAALYWGFGAGQRPSVAPSDDFRDAQIAPDFTLKNLGGEPVSLSQYRGKVVLLNFWASWCPPCKAEMPSMERLQEVFGDKDFIILAVNVEADGPELVPAFLEKNPYTFPVLYDNKGVVQQLYSVFKFPESFIIGKDGKIVQKVVGSIDWASPGALDFFNSLMNR